MLELRAKKFSGWIAVAAVGAGFAVAPASLAQAPLKEAAHAGGIWKAAVPPKPMRGEFDSLDPLGVAAGARIKSDCSLNWVSPDDGKLYCFSSGTSLEFFLDKPQATLERARAQWRAMAAAGDRLTGGDK
jgi:YHS domain-containing protein